MKTGNVQHKCDKCKTIYRPDNCHIECPHTALTNSKLLAQMRAAGPPFKYCPTHTRNPKRPRRSRAYETGRQDHRPRQAVPRQPHAPARAAHLQLLRSQGATWT